MAPRGSDGTAQSQAHSPVVSHARQGSVSGTGQAGYMDGRVARPATLSQRFLLADHPTEQPVAPSFRALLTRQHPTPVSLRVNDANPHGVVPADAVGDLPTYVPTYVIVVADRSGSSWEVLRTTDPVSAYERLMTERLNPDHAALIYEDGNEESGSVENDVEELVWGK